MNEQAFEQLSPESTILYSEDITQFYNWLALDEEGITWQGKYTEEFSRFWDLFFLDGLSVSQVIKRFGYIQKKTTAGPLLSWFKWLEFKFVVYCFVFKNMSIDSLSSELGIYHSKVATILRDYFILQAPFFEEDINELFRLGNITSPNCKLTMSKLRQKIDLPTSFETPQEEEMMKSLEVTLYPQWVGLIEHMKKDFLTKEIDIEQMQKKFNFNKQLKFAQEVLVLSLGAMILIFALRSGNSIYEKYLSDKVKILEPKFLWLNKDLIFQDTLKNEIEEKEILNEINEFENIVNQKKGVKVTREERFTDESDVVLSSVEELPHRLNIADVEQSQYEESKRGIGYNFRSYRFGHNKVYRIMLKEVRSDLIKNKMEKLLKKYGAIQADNVKPGTPVPGGLYYNLYVPREFLREFITEVGEDSAATLYETKTRGRNPAGKNRVFIFVKNI